MMRNAFVPGFVAIVFTATIAHAGFVPPDLNINISVDGDEKFVGNAPGNPTGNGEEASYEGMQNRPNWTFEWDLMGDPDPFITGSVSMVNNSGATQTFLIDISIPISPALAAPTLMGGSIQGGMTVDNTPGELSSVGDSIYRALIDGAEVGEPAKLFDDPTTTGLVGAGLSPSLGSESFGTPIPSAPGPAVSSSIGIRFEFSLTPGDRATFTASFFVIPAPGAAGVFAIAGLVGVRRRRRA